MRRRVEHNYIECSSDKNQALLVVFFFSLLSSSLVSFISAIFISVYCFERSTVVNLDCLEVNWDGFVPVLWWYTLRAVAWFYEHYNWVWKDYGLFCGKNKKKKTKTKGIYHAVYDDWAKIINCPYGDSGGLSSQSQWSEIDCDFFFPNVYL